LGSTACTRYFTNFRCNCCLAAMVFSAINQRFVVRKTFLEVTCDEEEFEREVLQRRNRSFTDACIQYNDASDFSTTASGSFAEESTASGSFFEDSTASGSFAEESDDMDSPKACTPPVEQIWGGFLPRAATTSSLEATAAALVVAAEHLASQARAARVAAASARVAAMGIDTATCTTVMFRNLPKNLTQVAVLETLENQGFSTVFDFVYLPVDFQKMVSFGYAVVNFVTHEAAERAMRHFTGFTAWPMPSRKACTTVWNTPCQGIAAHVERYRDSPLMHPDVAQEFKPMLFSHGCPLSFPLPTKQLKAPPRLPQKNALSKAPARTTRKSNADT